MRFKPKNVRFLTGLVLITISIALSGLYFSRKYARQVITDNECGSLTELRSLRIQAAWLWKMLSSCDPSYAGWRTRLESADLPTLFVVTPTHGRPTQKADLTRLSHTLSLVAKVHWVVVEDAESTSSLVRQLLIRAGLTHTLLAAPTPARFKMKGTDPNWLKPRGVWQRNAALSWLRKEDMEMNDGGVVYFADDDNTYDLEVFHEMRFTKKVSVWPVGIVGGLKWEGPRLENGKVDSWITAWKPERPFALDMAGFAINLRFLLDNPQAKFSAEVPRGFVESSLLESIVSLGDLEPKADNCSKVLVWHTRTENPKMYTDNQLRDLGIELDSNVEV